MYTVIFKSGHALEQYPKIKFRVSQNVRWLEHIPCLIGSSKKNGAMDFQNSPPFERSTCFYVIISENSERF